jgi:hypothetical protein
MNPGNVLHRVGVNLFTRTMAVSLMAIASLAMGCRSPLGQ